MAIANAVNGPEAAPYLAKSGGTMTGAINMGSHLINAVTDPVSAQDAATKNYVDQTSLNGTSVYAASAASLGTVTQSGAGAGATLTNAGAQATFALDGVNPPVGSNVLIKNTATGMAAANEGIYTVTDAGSGATNWVLTRATSYDTATEINNTGLIVVQNGSTLSGTAWYNATTIVTVDTTAFNYVRFGASAVTTIKLQSFTTPGAATYTASSGLLFALVRGVGAGGGSGGAAGAAGQAGASGGAGSGGYFEKLFTAAEMGATAAISIGTGGAGGSAGNNAGSDGGDTTFNPAGTGATLTGTGGGHSPGSASTATVAQNNGGVGSAASNGDINIKGGDGGVGLVINGASGVAMGGAGGGSWIGSPAFAVNNGSGNANNNYGSGGCGVNSSAGGANLAGNAGADGAVFVLEFCNQ